MSQSKKDGEDLYELFKGRDIYSGFTVNDIYIEKGKEFIEFTNGISVDIGQAIGDLDSDSIKRLQIRRTIEETSKQRKASYTHKASKCSHSFLSIEWQITVNMTVKAMLKRVNTPNGLKKNTNKSSSKELMKIYLKVSKT